ncbi:hypothetical protein QFZ51_005044 [Chitinophaga sp. W3I9]|uniref:hypothetical protein n=1 Tax=unclassified Chitinophaga TaxID=2619133 RepID=UPI003D1F2DA9
MLIILLRITSYGWAAIAIVVLSVLLAVKILKRNNPGGKPGCMGIGYVSLVVFCLLSLSATLAGVLGDFVVNAFTLPRYKAKVVSFSSYVSKDSKNKNTIMYRSTVAFTTKDGTPVEMETDVSSSGKPDIGEVITVGYEPGMSAAGEFSTSKYLLMSGAAVMLLVMGYFAIGGILYAMGWRMASFFNSGMILLLYFIIPLAMLFMLGGMGYAVVQYFMGLRPDMPVWAVVVCTFFCLVLSAGMLGYFRMLTDRRARTR